jgi:hypothetical protein
MPQSFEKARNFPITVHHTLTENNLSHTLFLENAMASTVQDIFNAVLHISHSKSSPLDTIQRHFNILPSPTTTPLRSIPIIAYNYNRCGYNT